MIRNRENIENRIEVNKKDSNELTKQMINDAFVIGFGAMTALVGIGKYVDTYQAENVLSKLISSGIIGAGTSISVFQIKSLIKNLNLKTNIDLETRDLKFDLVFMENDVINNQDTANYNKESNHEKRGKTL